MATAALRSSKLVAVVAIALAGVASGQARPGPATGASTQDELLAELRALRGELNQVFAASIRAQLLVARLQLQEQRIGGLARQLTETQERAAGHESGLITLAAELKSMEEPPSSGLSAEQLRDLERARERERERIKESIDQQRKRQQELRAQEASLAGQLSEAQSRWSEFSDRLDELERMLPVRPR
jgi:chromosome segregation ATPase